MLIHNNKVFYCCEYPLSEGFIQLGNEVEVVNTPYLKGLYNLLLLKLHPCLGCEYPLSEGFIQHMTESDLYCCEYPLSEGFIQLHFNIVAKP